MPTFTGMWIQTADQDARSRHTEAPAQVVVEDAQATVLEKERDLERKKTRLDWLLSPARLSARRKERIESLRQRNVLTAKAYQMRLNFQELDAAENYPFSNFESLQACF